MDRQELTFNEKKAHALRLGAIYQERLSKREHIKECEPAGGYHVADEDRRKKGQGIKRPVTCMVAQATGLGRKTLDARIGSASIDVGVPIDLDSTPPPELRAHARKIEGLPSKRMTGGGCSEEEDPSRGRKQPNGDLNLQARICPDNPQSLCDWLKRRYPKSLTLDQIRNIRDAIVAMIKDIESPDYIPVSALKLPISDVITGNPKTARQIALESNRAHGRVKLDLASLADRDKSIRREKRPGSREYVYSRVQS